MNNPSVDIRWITRWLWSHDIDQKFNFQHSKKHVTTFVFFIGACSHRLVALLSVSPWQQKYTSKWNLTLLSHIVFNCNVSALDRLHQPIRMNHSSQSTPLFSTVSPSSNSVFDCCYYFYWNHTCDLSAGDVCVYETARGPEDAGDSTQIK